MKQTTAYKVFIKEYNHIFLDTLALYRKAVDFYIDVILKEWEIYKDCEGNYEILYSAESITHHTKNHSDIRYDFDKRFYKFPSYLRRAAIAEAIGKVRSYYSNLKRWEKSDQKTKKPSLYSAGNTFPVYYENNMYKVTDNKYRLKIKIYIRNTWDFIEVELRKSDVDYIEKHCSNRKRLSPTLVKYGKKWSLTFSFEEKVTLDDKKKKDCKILAVDLGINSACTCSVMLNDGTILDRQFLKLSREEDCLETAANRIKKAQQNGNRKVPRLWSVAKGINKDISVKTAKFIVKVAIENSVDMIVLEHLDTSGKIKGSKRQRLHLWKYKAVKKMVIVKAHREGIRISTVTPINTSKLAYDGSGEVIRDKNNYSMCTFTTGKVYNCDLSASYNIGARYFIREITKSLPVTERLEAEAKVPELSKRSTCTLSTLIRLNALLSA